MRDNDVHKEDSGGLSRRDVLVKGGLLTAGVLGLPSLASAGLRRGLGAQHALAAPPGSQFWISHVVKNQKITVDTTKYKKSPPYTLGFATQGPFNGWGKMFDLVADYTAKGSGQVDKVILIPSNGNPSKQSNDMLDLITQKPDAIVLTPMSRAALSASVRRAMRAGIPVITCVGTVSTDNYVTEVGIYFYKTAFDNATALAKRLRGKGNVMMFNGIPGIDTTTAWRQGAHDAFAKFPGISIIADNYANFSIADAKKQASAVLQGHSKIDAVWAGGSEMAIGSIQAFRDADRKLPIIGACNPLNGFLRLAKQHKVKIIASPAPPSISQFGVKAALDVLHGRPVRKFIDGTKLVVGKLAYYDEREIAKRYKPQFNDDYIDPTPLPASVLIKAGFGR